MLLVEDEDAVRGMTALTLRERGYTVLEAANGEDALRVANDHAGAEIHLLLTDVVMPLMGGRELAMHFKEARPEARILYTSGYTDDAVPRQGVLEPGIDFIQKPFTPTTVARKVRDVLDRPVFDGRNGDGSPDL